VTGERKLLDKALSHALSGAGAHVETETVFADLDWRLAGIRPERAPHSVFEVLNHMLYWQEWVVQWLAGKRPPIPRHASGSWPGDQRPTSRKEWDQGVRRFRAELSVLTRWCREADLFSKGGTKSRLEMLQTIASHNSYHAGQVVMLRQVLGAWPPRTGGLTW
jgi:uncharacterized damage-inducible protein DinB